MKKLNLLLCALCASALVSCGGSPASQIIDLYEDATSDALSASSVEEIAEIKSNVQEEIMAIGLSTMADDPTYEPTAAEEEEMDQVEKDFRTACKSRKLELK